ncbi:MAG: hypothetical protein Q9181_005044, partial [Wetmoreana brouardii]
MSKHQQKLIGNPRQAIAALKKANPAHYCPRILTLTDAKNETKAWVDNIFDKHERLNFLMDQFGDIIRKRWLKKTPAQREKIITTAWVGEMPKYHRPDINAWLSYTPDAYPGPCTDYFVFPHINVDDLSKPRPLLVFMESRAQNSPDAFAAFDWDSMEIGLATAILIPPQLSGWTMSLLGRKTAKTYGQLRSWKHDQGALDLFKDGIGCQAGEGLTTLLVQSKLLDFLVRSISLIIPDIATDQPSSIVETEMAPSDSRILSQAPSSPLEALLEAPYRAPPPIDFRRLQSLIYAKHAEIGDHLWYLRQDPGYFRDTLYDFSEHQLEQLSDTALRPHPRLHTPSFWRRMIANLVTDAYGAPFNWSLTGRRLAGVLKLYESYKDRITPGKRLPHDLEIAITKLLYQLARAMSFLTICLQMGLQGSPPFRKYFLRDPTDDLDNPVIEPIKTYKNEIMLRWLLMQLKDERSLRFFGLHSLLSYVHRLMLSQPQGRAMVSGWVAKILSDMALINEIERQIAFLRLKRQDKPALAEESLRFDYAEQTIPLEMVFSAMESHEDIFQYDSPLELFNYPSDQERTEATTWGMRNAEKHLDILWEKVDEIVKAKTGKPLLPSVCPQIAERMLKRTPEWGAPANDFEVLSTALEAAMERLKVAGNELSEALDDLNAVCPPKLAPQAPQSTSDTPTPKTTCGPTPSKYKGKQRSIPLGKKAYKTFMTLFYKPDDKNAGPHPPDLAWSDFLNAMVNIGFTTEKLTGSAWIFTLKEDIEGESVNAIIFHEPHP